MNITIQINEFSKLFISFADLQEAQNTLMQPEMERLMSNPTKLTTYLELHEPSFSVAILEYFATDNLAQLKSAMSSFQISDEMFIGYLAHCFDVPRKNVTIDYLR